MTTLAEYNNNPGNIRPAKGVKYEGMIGVDDKGFAIFEKPEFGQKALVNDITHKLEKRGIKTPNEFVDIYSPKGDENSEDARDNYKIYIAQKLGLKSTNDPFPENAIEKLSQAITNFEGGKWQEDNKEETKGDASGEPSGDATIKDPNDIIKPAPKGLPGETDPYAFMGGVTGALVASHVEGGKKLLPLIPNLINKVGGQAIDVNKPVSRMALQNWLNSMLQSNSQNVKLPVSELEKLTGKKIRTMGELGEAYKDIQELKEQKVTKPMVKLVEGRPGVFEQTGRMTTSTVPGRAPIDLTPYEVKGGPLRQAVGRQMQTAGEVAKSVVPSVGRIGLGGLGGANAAVNAYDAWEMAQKLKEMKDPRWYDYLRLGTKTAATAGGIASMFPLGITQVVGAGLQAPEAAISLGENIYEGAKELNKRRKEATKEDTDRMLMNVDSMGNPMGGLP
jgi:hypothetical protein